MRRRVPALADAGYYADRSIGIGDKAIDQCRLSDAGMSDQGGQLVLEDLRQFVQGIVATGDDHLDVEVGESAREFLRRFEVALGQADDRRQATHVGGDQCALDEAGARWGIGECHDDEKLLRVRDDDTFEGIGVVGGPSQNVERSETRTMRARVSVLPDRSPTMST